jgi:hypothetical protein
MIVLKQRKQGAVILKNGATILVDSCNLNLYDPYLCFIIFILMRY